MDKQSQCDNKRKHDVFFYGNVKYNDNALISAARLRRKWSNSRIHGKKVVQTFIEKRKSCKKKIIQVICSFLTRFQFLRKIIYTKIDDLKFALNENC